MKYTIQTVPIIIRMTAGFFRGSGTRTTTPHQNASVPTASNQVVATQRNAINRMTTPSAMRSKPIHACRGSLGRVITI